MNILHVEDDPTKARVILRLLSAKDKNPVASYTRVRTYIDACYMLRCSKRPDAVVLDWNFPHDQDTEETRPYGRGISHYTAKLGIPTLVLSGGEVSPEELGSTTTYYGVDVDFGEALSRWFAELAGEGARG